MKILYLNGPEHDYMSLMLIDGFNVLSKLNRYLLEFRCLNPVVSDVVDLSKINCVGEKNAILSVDWADFIIFDSAGTLNWMSEEIKEIFLSPSCRKKTIFIDGIDSQSLFLNPAEFHLYVKRECHYPDWFTKVSTNVRSLSFGIPSSFVISNPVETDYDAEYESRDIDISFIAQNTNGLRMQFAQFLMQLGASNKNLNVVCEVMTGRRPVDYQDYLKVLRRSKMSFSAPGVGWDTVRYWEIPACGAVLVSYDLSYRLKVRSNYESGRHAIFVESFVNLAEGMSLVLGNKNVWKSMRKASDILSREHLSSARAEKIIVMAAEKTFSS